MSGHRIEVEDGGEYEGETYISCACGEKFTRAHEGWEALREFLKEHRPAHGEYLQTRTT